MASTDCRTCNHYRRTTRGAECSYCGEEIRNPAGGECKHYEGETQVVCAFCGSDVFDPVEGAGGQVYCNEECEAANAAYEAEDARNDLDEIHAGYEVKP